MMSLVYEAYVQEHNVNFNYFTQSQKITFEYGSNH